MKMPFSTVYLSLGSNTGNCRDQLMTALTLLEQEPGNSVVVKRSPVYRTKAWGKTDQPDFLNMAVAVHTQLRPMELMQTCLRIEQQMGRERTEKWGPRIIDIDILLYNDEQIGLPGLSVPHPELHTRNFVLAPLNDIAPYVVHPVLNKTISELLLESPDRSEVIAEGAVPA